MEEDNVEDDYEQFLQATAIRAAEKALEKVSIDEDDESILSSVQLNFNFFFKSMIILSRNYFLANNCEGMMKNSN